MADLDFGKDAQRVGLAIKAYFKTEALLTLLRRADDANNLMECMEIIGPKIDELMHAQFCALSDSLTTISQLHEMLGIKEVEHV